MWKFNFHWKCSLSTLMIPGNHLTNRQDIANALRGTPPHEYLWDPYVGLALSASSTKEKNKTGQRNRRYHYGKLKLLFWRQCKIYYVIERLKFSGLQVWKPPCWTTWCTRYNNRYVASIFFEMVCGFKVEILVTRLLCTIHV